MDSPSPTDIDVEALERMRREGAAFTIVDVREAWELDICAFEDSLAIPVSVFLERVAELPADRTLVIVCHHGIRSAQVAAWLRQNGYEDAVNLEGGIDAWARQIDTSMNTY